MIAVLGGLGAAVAWAVSTLCSSRSSRLIEPLVVVAWVMAVGLVITAPLAALHGVPSALGHQAGLWWLLAGAGNVGGLLLAYGALRRGQVALVAPLVSTEGAIAAVIALLAGETLAPGVGITLAAIVVGICLASLPPAERPAGAGEHRAEARVHHRETALLALAAACTFGLSLYATGRAGSALPTAWVVLAARLIGAIVIVLPLALRGRLRLASRVVPLVVTSGVCEVLGFYSYTAGARHQIAITAVLASQFGAIAGVAGYYLFGERLTRVQVAGVATVVAGVAVLSALRA
jgi:drug/metabolite transporter (DMT)-like permease